MGGLSDPLARRVAQKSVSQFSQQVLCIRMQAIEPPVEILSINGFGIYSDDFVEGGPR